MRLFSHPHLIDEETGFKRLNNLPKTPQKNFQISNGNSDYLAQKKKEYITIRCDLARNTAIKIASLLIKTL